MIILLSWLPPASLLLAVTRSLLFCDHLIVVFAPALLSPLAQVRRVQDIGGRTSVSLTFDPTAAGHRNVLEHINPVHNSILPPPLPTTARRRYQSAVPALDQVVITAADDARLNSIGLHHVERKSSIRTVGTVSGSSIVFA